MDDTKTMPTPSSGDETLEKLKDEEIVHLQREFAHLIDAVAVRIHYAETRRSTYSVIGGALIASGIALVPFVWNSVSDRVFLCSGLALALCSVMLGLTIWALYARQTNFNYPFKGAASTWKWFYRDALDTNRGPKTTWLDYVYLPHKKAAQLGSHYSEKRNEFRNSQWSLRDKRTSLSQDLDQIYILHINEKYKNEFLSHLRSAFSFGLILAALVTTGTFAVAKFAFPDIPSESIIKASDLELTARWKATGNTRSVFSGSEEIQLLLNVEAISKKGGSLKASQLIFKSTDNLTIPVAFQSSGRSSVPLRPAERATLSVLIWMEKRSAAKLAVVDTSIE